MQKRNYFLLTILLSLAVICGKAQNSLLPIKSEIAIKKPGNQAETFKLNNANGELKADRSLPLVIRQQITDNGATTTVSVSITATEDVYYNFQQLLPLGEMTFADCQFLMPGFWYHRNLRSPKEAPSFHTSDSWQVREDRLSTPLTGIYNDKTGDYYTVLRTDKPNGDCLTTHQQGEVILSGKTSLGYTGFSNDNGKAALAFGFPYYEAPKTYIRKLTLAPSVQALEKLAKGEERKLTWEIRKGKAADYAVFVAHVWNYSYDSLKPQPLQNTMSADQAKATLTNFFEESYVDTPDIDYFSGVHLRTDDCKTTGSAEVGFIGRVLLNAFNALEYAEQHNRPQLAAKANAVFDSYLKNGFTSAGFFREFIDYDHKDEPRVYSIRRQSEGAFAILYYLEYEKRNGRKHPEWENRLKTLFANFAKLQNKDGSFPRKFDDNMKLIDASGGSTPSATLPLVMAYVYFKNNDYLVSAIRTGEYLENDLISKSDYFSSTLDANCEDKEASLYASTAMYYLAQVSKGAAREKYINLSKQAAYFCLSWYYLWDVPFAQGQMLGDVNFKSRGWGNVSVENNHIDVFIFEFATVLDWLAKERKEPRFSDFANVIRSSMLQLMPVEGNRFDIAKVGFYPEVVQHTNWDYGKNGKGFYNDIFAPGWTVASLWQMLSPDRVANYMNRK